MRETWYKISDVLPEEGDSVVCYNVNTENYYGEMYFDNGVWYDENGVENAEFDEPPTHWLKRAYLPEFPIK